EPESSLEPESSFELLAESFPEASLEFDSGTLCVSALSELPPPQPLSITAKKNIKVFFLSMALDPTYRCEIHFSTNAKQ
ncbi:hypothetical protein CWB73_15140, partial [Pseudoalteromonas phenolica]